MPFEREESATEAAHESLHRFRSQVVERLLTGATADEVLTHVCSLVEERVEDAVCSIMTFDKQRGALFVKTAPCVPPEIARDLDGLVPGEFAGSCGTAVYTGEAVLVEDTLVDERWRDMRDFAAKAGIRACWSIPVRTVGEEIVGSFAISRAVPGLPDPDLVTLLMAAGNVVGLAIRRAVEERRVDSQDLMLRAVVEGTQDCIWVKDVRGHYVYANPAEAETSGRTVEEIIGHDDEELYGGKCAQRCRATDVEVVRTKSSLTYIAGFGAGEDERMYHVRKHPRFDDDGEVAEIVGVARDITDQERTQRALQQAQKMESLGLLAGGVAHDFNNLLVGVLGNAEWLLERMDCEPDVKASLEEIKHAATRAAALTKQFLHYAGRGSLSVEGLDIRALLRDVLELLHGSMSAGVDTRVTFPERLPRIRGDATQIQQILMNLLVNACESHEGGTGHIEIRADETVFTSDDRPMTVQGELEAGHYVRLTVTDDGAGMESELVSRIFDPFFTTKKTGRGLGLAVVLGILKAHQGGLRVSTAVDEGTTMEIFLPVERPTPSTGEEVGRALALVVDDEALVRNVTRRLLESASYEVLTAGSGREALRVVGETSRAIDVVVLDHNMPEMTGIETYHELVRLSPETAVVLVTGGADVSSLAESGAFVLAKPYTRDSILEACQAALKRVAAD